MWCQVSEGTAGIKSHSCLDLPAYKTEAIVTETSPFTRAISKGINNQVNQKSAFPKPSKEQWQWDKLKKDVDMICCMPEAGDTKVF